MWGKPSSELSVGNTEGGTHTVTEMWQSPGSDKKTAAVMPKDMLKTKNTVFFLLHLQQLEGEFERNAMFWCDTSETPCFF